MTSILADNSMFTTIPGDFFNHSLSPTNKESRERHEINLNKEQFKRELESLSHTGIRQDISFSLPDVVGIVHNLSRIEYHYNYTYGNSVVILFVRFKHPNEILLQEMLSEIDSLLKNEYDWDEIDYRKPTAADIDHAKVVLREFVSTISSKGYSVKKPYISNFEEGGASIKWKIGDRTLYLEIGQNESIVSKVWRESGKPRAIERPLHKKDYLRLWKWIINAE